MLSFKRFTRHFRKLKFWALSVSLKQPKDIGFGVNRIVSSIKHLFKESL